MAILAPHRRRQAERILRLIHALLSLLSVISLLTLVVLYATGVLPVAGGVQ